MSLFVRKIEIAKWKQRNILDGEQPSADAITRCMKTRRNKLSLWRIADEEELEEAVLAIVARHTHLETIDVLSMQPSLFDDKRLHLGESHGITPYTDFSNRHLDVGDLDYESLGHMADIIIESIRQDRSKRFTKSQLKHILAQGIRDGKILKSDLGPDVAKHLPATQ